MKHLIIVDLEATCWDEGVDRSFKKMEIIEIGAVKVDINRAEVVSEFDQFVRPLNNPTLSDFCKNLTSINQDDVSSADLFPVVWQKFLDWIGPVEESLMASWSKYDYWQFSQDCKLHGMTYLFEKQHLDIKYIFKRLNDNQKMGLGRAVKHLGLEFEGTQHRGIDDARNIWYVLNKIANGNIRAIIDTYFSEQIELF